MSFQEDLVCPSDGSLHRFVLFKNTVNAANVKSVEWDHMISLMCEAIYFMNYPDASMSVYASGAYVELWNEMQDRAKKNGIPLPSFDEYHC